VKNGARKTKNTAGIILDTSLEKKWLSLGVITSVAGSTVSSLIPPLVLADIIDILSKGEQPGTGLCISYFLLLLLSYAFESAKEGSLTVFGQKTATAVRRELCFKLTKLKTETLAAEDPGALVSRFVGDVDTVESLFTSGIISMAADVIRMIGILAVIAFKNPGLAILTLPLIPLIFIFTRSVQKKTLRSQLENREATACESAHIPESIRCLRTVKNTGAEAYMTEKYDSFIRRSYAAIEKTNFFDAIYSPVILIINALAVAAVMLLSASGNGTVLTLFGMSVGTAVAVINYVSQIFGPIESIGMEIQTVQSAVAGLKRIDSFLASDERSLPDASLSGISDNSSLPVASISDTTDISSLSGDSISGISDEIAVSFENVCFAYTEGKPVLNGLNLEIKAGEKLTLVGRTGAGKSTVFKLLMGLYSPQSGQVRIFGNEAGDVGDSERRRLFGCVEQSFRAVPGSILDNITLGDADVSRGDAERALELAGLSEALATLAQGIDDTPLSPGLFSQGQEQLLSVARAVAADPKILLLDEITANLDAETEKKLLAAIDRAGADRTLVSISHRLYAGIGGKTFKIS